MLVNDPPLFAWLTRGSSAQTATGSSMRSSFFSATTRDLTTHWLAEWGQFYLAQPEANSALLAAFEAEAATMDWRPLRYSGRSSRRTESTANRTTIPRLAEKSAASAWNR
jgi:hypothetical protein